MTRQAACEMQLSFRGAPHLYMVCFCLSMGIGNKTGFVGLEFRFITILSKRHSINSLAQHLGLSPFVSFCLYYTMFEPKRNQLVVVFHRKAATPREVERQMRLVLDAKRGVPERVQDTWLILGADILSNLSIRHAVQHIEPAFSVDAH